MTRTHCKKNRANEVAIVSLTRVGRWFYRHSLDTPAICACAVVPQVNKLYLVLEYCEKGDLMNILHGDARALTCDPMNDMDVWYITRQVGGDHR